jgi:alpha-L-fucosidase
MSPTRRELMQRSLALAAVAPFAGRGRVLADDQSGEVLTPEPRVARFERMGFGMFVHWGLYSQRAAGEWTLHNHKVPPEQYFELMNTFTARDFSGREVARVAKRGGMRYVTLTSRHHDGFSLYDTRGLSRRDVTHTPAGRDLIADFTEGCRAEGIVPMLYCTTLDWTDERFDSDWKAYQEYLRGSVEILCSHYGPIGGFWFDGNWSRKDADWEQDALYGVIRRLQPEALIINNTGIEHHGALGHPEIDSVTFERGRPEPLDRRGHGKWVSAEMCHTFNYHWGIAEKDFNYLSPAHVIEELVGARCAGANLLMNVGPTAEGAVPDYEGAALARVGDWIALNGGDEGPLYEGRPTAIVGEGRDRTLHLGDELYLFVFDLTATANSQVGVKARGAGPRVFTGVPSGYRRATWTDNDQEVAFEQTGERLTLETVGYPYGTNTVVRVARLTK